MEISHAKGSYIYDTQGRAHLDFVAGVSACSLGHCHPKIVQAIREQTESYMHVMVYGEYVQQPAVVYAKLLASLLPDSLETTYLVNSGTEAIEGAMKLARRYTGRSEIIAAHNAYHGNTMGSLSLMDYEERKMPFKPLLPDISFIQFNLEADLMNITTNTAAVFLETIQGGAGFILPQDDYLEQVRKRCDEVGALLILDEIQPGMASGLPVGAFTASKTLMKSLSENPKLGHITTFGGNPVIAAASLATLKTIPESDLMDQTLAKEILFRKLLQHKLIKEIRGRGLMLALLMKDEEVANQLPKLRIISSSNGLLLIQRINLKTMALESNERPGRPIAKFESMLKTDDVYFFDAEDFEDIIHHYLNNGKVALAKKAIKIGLQQHPDSIELKLLSVEVLVFENNLDLAEELLDKLQLLDSNNEEIYIQRANIYSKKDNHEAAIDLLNEALHLSENEDFDGAIYYLNDYLDQNPYSEVAWHQLGKQYFEKRLYPEALTAYDFAIISDDTFMGAYFEKGKVLEKLGRYADAIENYETTIKIEDPTSHAYLRIGKCHEKLENYDMAKFYYYQTVHEDPLLDKGWLAITNFYFKQKDHEKALLLSDYAYKQAVELGNYELDTWLRWADSTHWNKNFDSAVQILVQGRQFYPENATLQYKMAGFQLLSGDKINARITLIDALKNDIDKLFLFEEEFPQYANIPWTLNIVADIKKASR
ncbi:Acetylornithine aminotransferase [Nymphon striatum]|nr:Acetylornithine aminotransferase [Nymphon striatum]